MTGSNLNNEDQPSRTIRNRRIRLLVGMCLFAACVVYAVRSGVLATGGARWLDAKWLYVSGVCWRSGNCPYNQAAFYETWRTELNEEPINPFVFPPSIAVLVVPISLAPWSTAKHILDAVNLCALGACLFFLSRLLTIAANVDWRRVGPWLCLGAACLLSSVPSVLYIGQVTLLAMAGTLGAFCFWQQRRLLPAAVCVVFATMKPHVAVLPLLFMLVAGARREILLGAALTIVACACGLAFAPDGDLLTHLADSVAGHEDNLFNSAMGRTGLSSLCAGTPFELSEIVWSAMGAGLVTALAIAERLRYSPRPRRLLALTDDSTSTNPSLSTGYALQLPFAVAGAFMPFHAYDFVIYMPIVVFSLAARGLTKLWFIPPLLLIGRPKNIQSALAPFLGNHPGGLVFHLPSIGTICILLLVLLCWTRDRIRSHSAGA